MKSIHEIMQIEDARDPEMEDSGEETVPRVDGLIEGYLESLDREEPTQALVLLRALALAGLPRRRTKESTVTRRLRFGTRGVNDWVEVQYMTRQGGCLPFGRDRVTLMAIMHLAVEQRSPVVELGRANDLMAEFGIGGGSRGGSQYRALRASFKRLAGMMMSYRTGDTEEDLESGDSGGWVPMIVGHELREGRKNRNRPWEIRLSLDFFERLMRRSEQMLMPLDLIKLFQSRPLALDWALLLVSRCGAARSESVLTEECIMALFGDGYAEGNRGGRRVLKKRLWEVHEEVMKATGGRLNARLVELEKQGRRIPWVLKVGPSKRVVIPFPKRNPKLFGG